MGASPIDSSRAEFSGQKLNSPLFEIARVLVRVDHVASRIVNANHSIIADCVWLAVPQATEWQLVGN